MSDDDTDDGDDLETIAARIAAIAKANGFGGTSGATFVNLADAKAEIARLAQVDKVAYERERTDTAKRLGMRVRPWTTSSRRRGSRTSPPRMMASSSSPSKSWKHGRCGSTARLSPKRSAPGCWPTWCSLARLMPMWRRCGRSEPT